MKGRLIVALVLAAAIIAVPAIAQAASFASELPAPSSTVHVAPSFVAVDVLGETVKTATISVNSSAKATAAVKTDASNGAWSASESLDSQGVYHTVWTFTLGSVAARTTLIADPGVLATGTVNVSATGLDTSNVSIGTDNWSFTYASNGSVTPPTPPAAANQTCRSANCHGTTFDNDNAMGPVCTNCHIGKDAPHGFSSTDPYGGVQYSGTAISGHNTTLLGSIGANSSFPSLQWESEITSSSLSATYQTNLGVSSVTTGQVGTLITAWNLPTQSVFWPATSTEAPSTAIKGLSWNSVITCEDCHTGLAPAGPQGASAANFGLDPNYPAPYEYAELTKYVTANLAWPTTNSNYNTPLSVSGIAMFPGAATNADVTSASVSVIPTGALTALANRTDGTQGPTAVICAKCHKLETFISAANGGVNQVEGSNTAHDSHHQDQTDGSPQCVNCHIGLPHGWKRPRLLLNTDTDLAPYRSAKQLGTNRTTSTGSVNTGNTIKLTAGWGQGFNGQGMQSLSGWDQHTLQTTTLGHQGMAAWTESSCEACGFHTPTDGVRIHETP